MCLEIFLFVCLVNLQIINVSAQNERIVETSVGQIRGYKANVGDYYEFLGIPYGEVNQENLFSAAVPVPNFEGIFEANDSTSQCAQSDGGSTDCLHLFIYVPENASITNQMPVLLHIHGGGFDSGTGNKALYGPRFLMRHDVILVSINYRVHTYGFMCVDLPEVAGNQGFKDQLLAMRWVQNNIEYFGGDKDKITLIGHSAGAMSIDLHFMSDVDIVFDKAIVMSGTSYTPFLVREPNNTIPIEIARRLGHNTTDALEALRYLSTLPPPTVIATSAAVSDPRPCKENSYDGVERFLSEFPANVHELRGVRGKPFMVGYTDDELLTYIFPLSDEVISTTNYFENEISAAFRFDPETYNDAVRMVKNFYIGGANYSRDVVFDIIDFSSDMIHVYPSQRTLKRLLASGAEKAYYYLFSYVGGRNLMKQIYNISVGGAAHADELNYIYGFDENYEAGTAEDFEMVEKVCTMWTNFAKFGDPTPEVSDLLPTKWEPVTPNSVLHYLNIDRNLTMGISPFRQRLAFLDLFFETYGEYEHGYARGISAPLVPSTVFVFAFSIFSVFSFNLLSLNF